MMPSKDCFNAIQDPNGSEKMRHLTKKDRNFVQSHNCFLIRNYEKVKMCKYFILLVFIAENLMMILFI